MSLFRTHLQLARASVKENRTRSFLTCLGIAIGIASIILILSLTGSISRLISNEIYDLGANLIVVRPSTSKDQVTSIVEELTSANSFQTSTLTYTDVNIIKDLDTVVAAAPIAVNTSTLMADDNTVASATVLGTTPDFFTIEPLTLKSGTYLTDKNKDNSIVLGHAASLYLFNTSNSVGKTLDFHGAKFIVVGVLERIDESVNFDNVNFDEAIFMDLTALQKATGPVQIQQINVKISNPSALAETSSQITSALLSGNAGDTNFTVAYGDDITHPASALLGIVSGALAAVAGIALIVGGIGVMNIMLVSVAERTHEIGIRKAVGASASNILMQFILEALILSILGGVLGVVLGYLCAFLISIVTPFTPYISWQILVITFCVTIAVGLIFGIYPALKAAHKNPIDSLKHYR